jgi:DNA-binding PadR family transcriptional regulator
MALTDQGAEELQDLFRSFAGIMDGYLSELDKIILTEDGEDADGIEDIIDLMRGSIDNFEEDAVNVYDDEFMDDDEDFIDDEDFED